MRPRLSVMVVSGVVAGLALASVALGAHSMTAPSAVAQFDVKNRSGLVAFTWAEADGFHGTKRYTSQWITNFRFHDGCTNSITNVKPTINVRRNRFSYSVDSVRIGNELNDVTIAGRVRLTGGAASAIKGTITLSDPDCAADPNGVITFDA